MLSVASTSDMKETRETLARPRLEAFAALLERRAVSLGLVAESDRDRVWERHIQDSLRATEAFRPEDRLGYDLGSGAGLPGIVLACALPDRRFRLIEPRRKAVAFLELAVERLGLTNVEALGIRAEDVDQPADVVTARAFAPPDRSWAAARRLLRSGGRLVYFAGERLGDPEGLARRFPEPPDEVEVLGPVDSSAPLVIMSRR
jgi:16S rRNA (guanine527-N7)-methyltransferase